MRPLEAFATHGVETRIPQLLRGAPAADVEAELARLDAMPMSGALAAARSFARGALALREGRLAAACTSLEAAMGGFDAAGDAEARALTECELWLGKIRRGPQEPIDRAAAGLRALTEAPAATRLVRVVALHYLGTARRNLGRAEETLATLLEALALSDGLLPERAQVLASLGTLYVVLGAYGAATAMLEHAADLARQLGDVAGEAIVFGQLGSAALGAFELDLARRHLQRQEWLASRIGDRFGQARATVLLADLALDLGRPDDARELAVSAANLARSVEPPLELWLAYAARSRGRAELALDEPSAASSLAEAHDRYHRLGTPLGGALVRADAARALLAAPGEDALPELAALLPEAPTRALAHTILASDAAFALGSLGLTQRVFAVLRDTIAARRGDLVAASDAPPLAELEAACAALGQPSAALASKHEIELAHDDSATLAAIAARRIAAQRNLGRMAALCLAPRGLIVAALASGDDASAPSFIPPKDADATELGALPGAALWAWRGETPALRVAADLARLSASCPGLRAAVAGFASGRAAGIPFAGEGTARLEAVDTSPLFARCLALAPSTLALAEGLSWTDEASAVLAAAGLATEA